MAELSHSKKKIISVLVDRKGRVRLVHVGDTKEINYSEKLGRSREAKYRLRGYRLIHTHLKNTNLSPNDFSNLVTERLDLICLINVTSEGKPGNIEIAHIIPPCQNMNKKWQIYHYNDIGRVDIDFTEIIEEVEEKMEKLFFQKGGDVRKEGVVLVGFDTRYKKNAEASLEELHQLALSSGKVVLDKILQVKKQVDPRYLIGKGKLKDVILKAKQLGADSIIFDVELTPAQANSIAAETNLKILDRTQLILEIFAKHATSTEGKIQVKLAELKYNLPRLKGSGLELSQLGGGIGTRGPGEQKLEIEKRRIRKQIEELEKKIDDISKRRFRTRKRRIDSGIPTVSLIGYTNVGKSTLFNLITKDSVLVKNKLFSTLGPTTRRVRLPSGTDVLFTDTVGFITHLPKELINAFRATLEELGESSLLLHIADASDPLVDERIEAVEHIVKDMGFQNIPTLLVLNKIDKVNPEIKNELKEIYRAPLVSAATGENIEELLEVVSEKLLSKRNPLFIDETKYRSIA